MFGRKKEVEIKEEEKIEEVKVEQKPEPTKIPDLGDIIKDGQEFRSMNKEQTDNVKNYCDLLEQTGFNKNLKTIKAEAQSSKSHIIKLPQGKIQSYLSRIGQEYLKSKNLDMREFVGYEFETYSIRAKFGQVDHQGRQYGNSTKVFWEEILIQNYQGNPPQSVLEKLVEVQKTNVFDEFTIAEVDIREIKEPIRAKDPLLIGRIKGSSDRYIIAQWGDDIYIDDLI